MVDRPVWLAMILSRRLLSNRMQMALYQQVGCWFALLQLLTPAHLKAHVDETEDR